MRGVLLFAAFVTIGACSTSAIAPPEVDAGNGANRALGTTCVPTLADACEQPTDACSVAVCDPTSRVCTRVAVDAGPACSNGSPQVPSCPSGECDAAVDAGDAAADAGLDASDASDASDSGDAYVPEASTDAPFDASDAGGD